MTPVRGTARKAGMTTSSLTRSTLTTDRVRAGVIDADLVPGAGGAAVAAMVPIGRQVVAGAVAVALAEPAGGHARALGAELAGGAGMAAGAAVVEGLDALAVALVAVLQADGLVQAVVAGQHSLADALAVILADQRARGFAA